ncbi:helix-turn-helix domain-containing protein [Saccharothrix syringae]|uniref:XRE family transcriptional regulator n=1 Tax=Saccharothrix syringae TaxID=103733 RepID=A0A5Q0HB21_SACSY|nr:helix-turn-helix transcriptional regulator [Saccharothrix syringae]QFZ23164.1 XRE family transcriptional regulator [Saccharothrix syringae]
MGTFKRRCRTCDTLLASDNRGIQCGKCAAASTLSAPALPREFWTQPALREAFESRSIGEVFRAYRKAQNPTVSQTTLAAWLDLTQGRVSEIERTRRPVTDLERLERWCNALHVPHHLRWFNGGVREVHDVQELYASRTVDPSPAFSTQPTWAPVDQGSTAGPQELDIVHVAIPRLRRALDILDLPDDGPTRSLAELRADVALMNEHRLEARYGELVRHLPGLIGELARARQLLAADDRRQAASLLTLALRAADGVAYKYRYFDLSARLIDLMRTTAQESEDPLLPAAVSYVRTETFFASGDLHAAARALDLAADQIPTRNLKQAPTAAAFGALHMRAAVVAARAGKADIAADHLLTARYAIHAAPEGVYHGTAFGPASLRIHELAVAAELRDPAGIQRAATWQPPRELPAERRSHYYIDLARAQLDLGHHEDAYVCLQAARQAAPEHTRAHPQVRQALSVLLRTHPSLSTGLLDLAAWAGAR